ncbi:HBL/NHE enterotoxin family protein [Bacillus sp. 196mf]|uniref:HBL/NHE enterotoxin family protein n=1 Tax=Bacillus sp. 196mf TaxID=1761754 RepID=UPI000D7CF1E4|nr:HBL/NHE enterotoxin family protein [Bacillus sp. 196mf]PYE87497.1 hemolytic enterotoxin HBL [Bacillus sp. 196mf]
MKKKSSKALVLSTLLVVSTSNMVAPIYSFASEKTTQENSQNTKEPNKEPTLGPNELAQKLGKAYTNIAKVSIHARVISQQTDVSLEDFDKKIEGSIVHDQELARGNSKNWLQNIVPMALKQAQGIIDYNTQYQNYHEVLIQAAKKHDKQQLLAGLEKLKKKLTSNREGSQELKNQVDKYQNDLYTDERNYKSHIATLNDEVSAKAKEIEQLNKKIEMLHNCVDGQLDRMEKRFTNIWDNPDGAWGGFVSFLKVASGVNAYDSIADMKQVKEAEEELVQLQNDNKKHKELENLTVASKSLKKISSEIQNAQSALEDVTKQWTNIINQFDGLINQIENSKDIDETFWIFVEKDLETAKDQWAGIQKEIKGS